MGRKIAVVAVATSVLAAVKGGSCRGVGSYLLLAVLATILAAAAVAVVVAGVAGGPLS